MGKGPLNIGPYQLARLVKQGGEGTVYEAHDQSRARKVAVKLIPLPSAGKRDKLIEEVLALARFSHPNVVQIHDVVQTPSHLAIVMDYIVGTDLQCLLDEGTLDVSSLIRLMIELCSAVSAVHRRGFVHRDLKPGNVLLDKEGKPHLTDFGIATPLQAPGADDSRASDFSGTYYAMSPEHVRGEPVDQRSDVFALGLILYRGLTGRHPFPWHGDREEFVERLGGKAELPLQALDGALPDELVAVLARALSKDVSKRYFTVMEMRHDLQNLANVLPAVEVVSISTLVAQYARPEQGRALLSKSPAGNFRGARSLVMSRGEWGPWGFSNRGLYQGMAYSALALGLFITSIHLTLMYFERPDWKMQVLPSIVVQDESYGPAANQLQLMLTETAESLPGTRVSDRQADERLLSRLRCSREVCELRLSLDRNYAFATDTLEMLPGSASEQWRSAIERSLEKLFAGMPKSAN